jgi:predicted transcriptional regulator
MSLSSFIPIFEALGNETRLRVFEFIYLSGNVGARPKELIDKFGFDSGTLDFHLKKLIAVELISYKAGCRRGTYCVNEVISNELVQLFDSAIASNELSTRLTGAVGAKQAQGFH